MSSQRHVQRRAGTVGQNAVRMDTGKAERVVEALNLDLATVLVLYHQFRKHHWTVDGVRHRGLGQFFREAADDAIFAADDFADRVHALGGVPVSGPAALERHSTVPFEGEDVYDLRSALSNDLRACGDLVEQVSSHVELAESYGDHVTGEILRYHLVALEEYAHTIDRFLHEDGLSSS